MASPPGRLLQSDGNTLAYEKSDGAAPGIVFLHGLNSDRHGNKADALAAYCSQRGYGFLRYDMYGHGESSGRFEDGGPTRWRDDALAVLDNLTSGRVILVGSSMGGWVMLLAALERPTRIAGLMGIAAAPDFTNDASAAGLTTAQWEQLRRDGVVEIASAYDEKPMRIGRHLIDDGNRNLLLGGPIAVTCPVRLLHGQRDESVPWQRSMRIAECVAGDDVEVILAKDGDHRLSRDRDLALMCSTLDLLVEHVRS